MRPLWGDMLRHFERLNRPLRIKSIRELEPGFTPRWFKICFRAVVACFLFLPVAMIGAAISSRLLQAIGTIGFFGAFVVPFVVSFFPLVLRVLGYWWPWLGMKSAQLDAWLERDLDWGN